MIDLKINAVHKSGFLSKLLSTYGGAHIHNVTLAVDHDNFDLIGLTDDWNSFDNYDEDTSATIDFEGKVMGPDSEGGYYVRVDKADGCYLVYNTPESEYEQVQLQDEALYYNPAGTVAEAIELRPYDIFAVSANGFSAAPKTGATVTYSNGKYVVSASI